MKSIKKKLIPFRLHEKDIIKLKQLLVLHNTNFQKVCELLVILYLEGDEYIAEKVKSVSKNKNGNKRRYTSDFDDLERSALFHRIEQISNLSETQQILEEIEKGGVK